MKKLNLVALLILLILAVQSSAKTNTSAEEFWTSLEKLCGKTFSGEVLRAPAGDVTFKDKKLVMHVRVCEKDRIRIPFFVGEDRSRTWVFTKKDGRILLKHDHRHKDGTADEVTNYGGLAANLGSATTQIFPADSETAEMLPAAVSNVWWVELIAGESFTYNLQRLGTERLFSIRFDLTKEIETAPAPWGSKQVLAAARLQSIRAF